MLCSVADPKSAPLAHEPRTQPIEGQAMTFFDGESSREVDTRGVACAEALIIKLYRCVMAGFSTSETQCWEIGWRALGETVPPTEAGPLFGHFYGFGRALLAVTQRPLSWRPPTCRGLCDDEALALRMIETAQRADPVGLLAAASMLLGVDELGDALQATQSLASALRRRGLIVAPSFREEPCGFDLCPHRRLN
jgi:hypothetical protein